tara:strand:+ start:998 stop:1945 length:948 start_codon:yes stop_codon:yes gene_type:complete
MISRIKNKLIVYHYNFVRRAIQKKQLEIEISNASISTNYLRKNSKRERFVEIKEEDDKLENVLFSCYFIKKENPQTGEVQGKANFEYIKEWYESVKKLNINAIIIHDGIDEQFINEYETEKIKFRIFYAGNHPIIDERWIIFYMFMMKTKIKKAFFTDIGDVIVTRSPFELISEKNQLFIGRDNANKIRLSGWILNEVKKFLKETQTKLPSSFYFQSLYNVGIVGGNRNVILFLLGNVIEHILLSDESTYKEMTIFNIVIHKYFFPKLSYSESDQIMVNSNNDADATHNHLISGFPLNSLFKEYEYNSDAFFIHK